MKMTIGELEFTSAGQSSKGADRFKAETTVNGIRLYITAYGKAPENTESTPKANNARGSATKTGGPAAVKPTQGGLNLDGIDPAKLAQVLARMGFKVPA